MEASAQQLPTVKKRLYHNNTGGYVGVVKINANGEEVGVNCDPFGDVYLSDAEAIATARAPKRAEDNPFEEQTFVVRDEVTQAIKEIRVRPLELVGDGSRYVPAEGRLLPPEVTAAYAAQLADGDAKSDPPVQHFADPEAVAAAHRVEGQPPVATQSGQAPPSVAAPPSSGAPSVEAPPAAPAPAATAVPSVRREPPPSAPTPPAAGLGGQAGAPQGEEGEAKEEWTSEPEAPGQVLQGSLGGAEGPPPEVAAAAAPDPTLAPPGATGGPPQAPVPPVPPQNAPPETAVGPMVEEHAAVDPAIGEETGAAKPPTGVQPEGEFGQAEEVGSPDAPAEQSSSNDREE